MQIGGNVSQRGQGLVVVEGRRGSKSFRYERKMDEGVLEVSKFWFQKFYGQQRIPQALRNSHVLQGSLRAVDIVDDL